MEKISNPAIITSSNCGSDSGISSDVTVSRSNSSEESTTTTVISDSNEELNDISSQYITVSFGSPQPITLPTNDASVHCIGICGQIV